MSSEATRRSMRREARMTQRCWQVAAACAFCSLLGCADFERGPRVAAPENANGDAGLGGAGAEPGRQVSFAAEVHPLLLSDCALCHSSDGSASDTAFLLSGDESIDYQTTSRFLDPSAPSQSRLLSKARGTGHQPGAIYPESSDEHQLLVRWISDGALP